MAERVVELRGISKSWGAVRALVNVDATFATGVCHAVLGANGSGKSTLLALVATLATPTSGTLAHRGFGADRTAIRASLGWLGHDALCYPELTGRENLRFAASLYGCGEADVEAACMAMRPEGRRWEAGQGGDRFARDYRVCAVDPATLERGPVDGKKGDYVIATRFVPGQPTLEVLPALLAGCPKPKTADETATPPAKPAESAAPKVTGRSICKMRTLTLLLNTASASGVKRW